MKTIAFKALLPVVAIALLLGFVELTSLGYGLVTSNGKPEAPSMYLWSDQYPEVYRHNPAHSEIDDWGLRYCGGDSVSGARPDSQTLRILFLGDSTTYGHGVGACESFASLVGKAVELDGLKRVESLNAGVSGYNTYNEYQAYMTRYFALNPDLVVLVTSLNDFVSPRLHWADEGRNMQPVPVGAIPNLEYDRTHAMPVFNRWQRESKFRRFATYRLFSRFPNLFSFDS